MELYDYNIENETTFLDINCIVIFSVGPKKYKIYTNVIFIICTIRKRNSYKNIGCRKKLSI